MAYSTYLSDFDFDYNRTRHHIALRLRALHIWLIRGRRSPQLCQEPCTCLNCGTTYTANYCPRCGQTRTTRRYQLRNALSSIAGSFFNIDSGFSRTLLELLYRPGHMIRDYIGGKRSCYFGAFQTLFVLAALYIMAVQLVDPEALRKDVEAEREFTEQMLNDPTDEVDMSEDEDARLLKQFITDGSAADRRIDGYLEQMPFLQKVWDLLKSWAHGNKAFRIIATLPLFAVATRLAFNRRRRRGLNYNLAEHLFVQAFISCQILLLSILVLPFYGHAQVDNLYELPVSLVFLLFVWDYSQLYNCSLWRSFWRTLLMFFYSLLILILFACAVVALVIAAVYLLR